MNKLQTQSTDDFEEDLTGLLDTCGQGVAPEGGGEALTARLAALLDGVEPGGPKDFMRGIFAEIARLIGEVENVTGAVENEFTAGDISRMLDALRKSSRYLLTNIETAELRFDGLPDSLVETLNAVGFALGHELRRVFDAGPTGPPGGRDPHQVLRGCALLENCFQQLTVSLARSYDAGMTAARLFENYRKRQAESFLLRDELRALLKDAHRAERERDAASYRELLQRARRFRYECMHYLMYQDWEDFERFADALEVSRESGGEMELLLNRLSCYLETLLNQVKLRAVLHED